MVVVPDRELVAKIEASRRRLIDHLGRHFPDLRLSNLSAACEALESEVVAFLVETAIDNAGLLFSMRKSADRLHLVDQRGQLYQVATAPDVREPTRHFLAVRAAEPTEEVQQALTITIEGYGSCRAVVFMCAKSTAKGVNFGLLRSWVKSIFESAYDWFFEVAGSVTNFQLSDLAKQLYEYSRRYIPRETLGTSVWFSAIIEGYGFRLIEPHVARNAFRLIAQHNSAGAHSTNEYVVDLLGTSLPEKVMLMRKAIDDGVCVDVDLSGTEYRKDGMLYAMTLTALYGHEAFSIYPVFKGTRLSVGSVFPTDIRKDIEPILDEIVDDLASICMSYKEPTAAALRIFTSSAYIVR